MATKQFFVVCSPTLPTPPKYKHESYEGACAEAQRLARQYDGQEFFVMGSIVGFVARKPVETIEVAVDEEVK